MTGRIKTCTNPQGTAFQRIPRTGAMPVVRTPLSLGLSLAAPAFSWPCFPPIQAYRGAQRQAEAALAAPMHELRFRFFHSRWTAGHTFAKPCHPSSQTPPALPGGPAVSWPCSRQSSMPRSPKGQAEAARGAPMHELRFRFFHSRWTAGHTFALSSYREARRKACPDGRDLPAHERQRGGEATRRKGSGPISLLATRATFFLLRLEVGFSVSEAPETRPGVNAGEPSGGGSKPVVSSRSRGRRD